MQKHIKMIIFLLCFLIALCPLSACSQKTAGEPSRSSGISQQIEDPSATNAQQTGTYPPQSLLLPSLSGEEVRAENAGIDYGHASEGYVMAWYQGEKKAKVQIIKDDQKYNYDLNNQNAPEVFPLSLGDGAYTVKVFEQIQDNRYAPLVVQEVSVTLESEFAPFLRPHQLVSYDEDSLCVQRAYELSAGCTTDTEVVSKIYGYIKENIKYDKEKAQSVSDSYIPNPDETLESKKGICYDYASLACAMLRANGIPTKMITGYVSPSGIYHSWNEIYLENSGWIEVKIYVDLQTWEIIDLTFAAGMTSEDIANYIGDGESYTQRFVY